MKLIDLKLERLYKLGKSVHMRALEKGIHAGFVYGYSYCKDQGEYKATMLVLTNQDLSDQSDMRNITTINLHTTHSLN